MTEARFEDREMVTPELYAAHLATYIASPPKIESLTKLEFGKAPPLHEIAEMWFAVEREKRNYFRQSPTEARRTTRNEGDDYVLPSLLRRAKSAQRPRVRDYINIATPLPKPSGNPFLQLWRLTRAVAESVAEDFDMPAEIIMGKSRRLACVDARAVVTKLLDLRGLTAAEIGRRTARDHSTVLHALDHFDIYVLRNETAAASYQRHLKLIEEAERVHAATQDNEAEASCAA